MWQLLKCLAPPSSGAEEPSHPDCASVPRASVLGEVSLGYASADAIGNDIPFLLLLLAAVPRTFL